MAGMQKSTFLFLALLLPVLIFLFLRFFGKNEFAIPVYYELVTDDLPQGCGTYTFPYRVPGASAIPLQGASVVFFGADMEAQQLEGFAVQIDRLKNQVFSDAIKIVWIDRSRQNLPDLKISTVVLDSISYNQEKVCAYLMQTNMMVLVDSVRQIRGYYKEASLKETDRLIMELKILFNKY